jgi:hypothetical protein
MLLVRCQLKMGIEIIYIHAYEHRNQIEMVVRSPAALTSTCVRVCDVQLSEWMHYPLPVLVGRGHAIQQHGGHLEVLIHEL